MGDQRRSSWLCRKLKLTTSSNPSQARADKSSADSQLASSAASSSTFKAESSSPARIFSHRWKRECSTAMEDGGLAEAIALKEKAEENLKALKQELGTLMKELNAKEALVKQHQKVADEAVSGWEKSDKEVLSLKQELDGALQQNAILHDRIAQVDGALKECTRQVRHVRDEQEIRLQEVTTCKDREMEEVKADMGAKQADLLRTLMESDAQNSALAKSLQEQAWKILEANEANSKANTELKIMQAKLGSAEKDISSLQYELHLLSKELEIRNEEVVFCKKSADAAHKQHLDNVHKSAKLEGECQRLRVLLKKKLPGPAAIVQMRKEVEGLSKKESPTTMNVRHPELKKRPSWSYASTTVSFSNSYQKGICTTSNRSHSETLRDRLMSMEEENKLLKEALSKRMGELQVSRVLCAKTVNKLSIAEDHLESLQGTPRAHANTDRSFEFGFTTPETGSVASLSDVEEASCAESWASALMSELAQIKREKTITKEAIMEVTEPCRRDSSTDQDAHVVDIIKDVVQHEETSRCVNDTLPEFDKPSSELVLVYLQGQHIRVNAMSLLCTELNHKLDIIQEAIRAGKVSEKLELIEFVDAAQKVLSVLNKEFQHLKSSLVHSPSPEDVVKTMADSVTIKIAERNTGMGVEMPGILPTTVNGSGGMVVIETKGHQAGAVHRKGLSCEKNGPNADADLPISDLESYEEEKHEDTPYCGLSYVLSMLVSLLERLPRRGGGATTSNTDWGHEWEQEKQGLENCMDRIVKDQGSMLEILLRMGMLMCRACHIRSQELEPMLASLVNTNTAPEKLIRINAAEFLPCEQQQDWKPSEVESDLAIGVNELDELAVHKLSAHEVMGSGIERKILDDFDADPAACLLDERNQQDSCLSRTADMDAKMDGPDELDANLASLADGLNATLTKPNDTVRTNANMAFLADELDATLDTKADMAACYDELELPIVAAPVMLDVASKLARLRSEQEKLCEERDKLMCEGGLGS